MRGDDSAIRGRRRIGRGTGTVWVRILLIGFIGLLIRSIVYRVEVNRYEIRIRYMPFYQDRVPVSAVTGYEYSTGRGFPSLVLLTPDSKIAMPNLADTPRTSSCGSFPG